MADRQPLTLEPDPSDHPHPARRTLCDRMYALSHTCLILIPRPGMPRGRMPSDFLPILVILVLSVLLGFVAIGIGHLFGPRRPTEPKGQPYESGMRPYGEGQRRVRVQFYLMAVLFILFDIEIVFLLPWAVVLRQLGAAGLVEMGLFLVILLVGYVYAWKVGALEWE
ncbi:MAG TPA: NADH-quinone oxidoreductase subunit A [Anaerolineales bacterium]|nr:NADH-quinone oxidoreductase subunit A [Anaerolineales bacterium]